MARPDRRALLLPDQSDTSTEWTWGTQRRRRNERDRDRSIFVAYVWRRVDNVTAFMVCPHKHRSEEMADECGYRWAWRLPVWES